MTREEAISAIKKAELIFVHVITSRNYDGSPHHTENFRVRKDDAIAAMMEISGAEYEPFIECSKNGRVVIIGRESTEQADENFSHFENNNGNF
jgi:hypothetical protein